MLAEHLVQPVPKWIQRSCVELTDSRCEDGAQRPNDVKHFLYFPFFFLLRSASFQKVKGDKIQRLLLCLYVPRNKFCQRHFQAKIWHTRQGRNTETPSTAVHRPQPNPLPTSLCRALLLGCCGLRPRVATTRTACQSLSGQRTFFPRRTHQDSDCVSGLIVIGR